MSLNQERWSMSIRWNWISVRATAFSVSLAACGGSTEPTPLVLPAEVILAAGNIATCGMTNDEATAALLDNQSGTVFALGDNAIPDGSLEAYALCYEPSWGRFKPRTYAALGNHEYATGTASGTFDYFGDRAGPRDRGYYSFDLGNWHIVVLNVNDFTVDSLKPFSGTAQDLWLQSDLAANSKLCTLAMWHSPRFFSSNTIGYTSNLYVTPVWDRLYAAGVDVVLNGHQHQYERFPPMTPSGLRDDARGIRQFNAGTGGESVEMPIALAPDREALTDTFGVLKLTLDAGSYSWEFLSAVPGQFSDSGSGTCH
jgi:acid phosphatase type 7